jgi:hypothetical protein
MWFLVIREFISITGEFHLDQVLEFQAIGRKFSYR